jgi:hypothetical protein
MRTESAMSAVGITGRESAWMLDSTALRARDRQAAGLPESFDSWLYYKVARDDQDNLVVVADRPRPYFKPEPEPVYRALWADTDTGRAPTAYERREADRCN